MDINFLVRVSCMTFNHAPYIEDAMNGFCMQETSFPFLCTIMDDASTDGEQEVIKNYLQEHFDLDNKSIVRNEDTDDYEMTFAQHKTNKNCYFAVFFLKYNHYSIKKSKGPYIEEWKAQVKYIAICEGDDYWIDPYKIQNQTEFLESHTNYGLCYSKAIKYIQAESQIKGSAGRCIVDFHSLLLYGNHIPTLTTLYKAELYLNYAKEKKQNWKMGDYPLWLYIAYKSKIHFENKVYGVYRILKNSACHFTTYEDHEKLENSLYDIQLFYSKKCEVSEQDLLFLEEKHYKRLFRIAYEHKNIKKAKYYFNRTKHKDLKMFVKIILINFSNKR